MNTIVNSYTVPTQIGDHSRGCVVVLETARRRAAEGGRRRGDRPYRRRPLGRPLAGGLDPVVRRLHDEMAGVGGAGFLLILLLLRLLMHFKLLTIRMSIALYRRSK